MIYPFCKDTQNCLSNYSKGNYSLWFNKFVPVSEQNMFKYCEEKTGKSENALNYYQKQYEKVVNGNPELNNLLLKKHHQQIEFCENMSSCYHILTLTAKLQSPLVIGIGQTHPCETGITFDHNLGITYIPASSLKGVIRFAHTLEILKNYPLDKLKNDKNGLYLDETDPATFISEIFGGEKMCDAKKEMCAYRGKAIFLDAYPTVKPELYVDIMTPHYGDYYSGDRPKPPTDTQDPNPIKFLTVNPGISFAFRVLVEKTENGEKLTKMVKIAIGHALEDEGIGAKTANGYGRFSISIQDKEDDGLLNNINIWRISEDPILQIKDKIDICNGWGELKQKLENEDFVKQQNNVEVARKVKEKANKFALGARKKGKWTEDRDQLIADWLEPSGIKWETSVGKDTDTQNPMPVEHNLSLIEQEQMQIIKKINDFNDYSQQNKFQLDDLSQTVARQLKNKISQWEKDLQKKKLNKKKKKKSNIGSKIKMELGKIDSHIEKLRNK